MNVSENILHERAALGARIKGCRQAQDLTQKQLANIAGISRFCMGRIENGQAPTSFDAIVLISNALGLSPSELLAGIADPASSPSDGLLYL